MELAKLYFNIVPLLAALAVFVIGLVVFIGDRKNRITRLWFLTCLCAALWSAFFFFVINASTKEASLVLRIFLDASGILVMYFWLRFVLAFLEMRAERTLGFVSVGTIALLVFNVTPWFIVDMIPKYIFSYYVDAGVGYYFFVLYFSVVAITGLFFLYRSSCVVNGLKSEQIKNIFRGSLLGFIGSSSAFLLSFNVPLPPYLFILFAGFPIIIGRGIVRYNLFNIRVIATELLTLAIWIFLAIRLMFSETTQDVVINAVLLAGVIIFGILLVKSVWNEVRQREKIEKLAVELEEANKRQEALIHFVSHEVKGYLNDSKAGLSVLIEGDYGELTPEAKGVAEQAFDKTNKGVRQVEDILKASNLKSGKVAYENKTFDVAETIKKLSESFKKEAEAANIKFEADIVGAGQCIMSGDEANLSDHVFGNLLRNTIAYAAGANVTLKLQRRDGKILFSLKDTGVGMTPKTLANLFTEGGRGEDSLKVNAHSTGYGLFIAKGIVEAHRGRIWAESEGAGKGSTFYVELPIA